MADLVKPWLATATVRNLSPLISQLEDNPGGVKLQLGSRQNHDANTVEFKVTIKAKGDKQAGVVQLVKVCLNESYR